MNSNSESLLLNIFTDNPINWVKWAVVFVVFIFSYIVAFKLYKKYLPD